MSVASQSPTISNHRDVRQSGSDRISTLAFVLLFPGYLFYHFAVAAGHISPVLGGYFGVVSLALVVPLVWSLSRHIFREGISIFEASVFLLLIYLMLWMVLHFAFGAPYQSDISIFVKNLSNLVLIIVIYAAARLLPVDRSTGFRLYAVLFFSMVVVVLMNVDEDLVLRVLRSSTVSAAELSTYQGFARSVLVISLLMLASSRGIALLTYITLTAIALLFIGARSEFVGFLAVILLMTPFWVIGNKKLLLGLVILSASAIYFVATIDVPIGVFRIAELLDLENSASYIIRTELSRNAVSTILDNPILGNYASDKFGYAHNVLSAWVTYGLIGFCLYVFLVIYPTTQCLRRLMSPRMSVSPLLIAAFCFNSYSLVMFVFAKSVSDPVIAIGWGFFSATLANEGVARFDSRLTGSHLVSQS